jgi:hypothetical protein
MPNRGYPLNMPRSVNHCETMLVQSMSAPLVPTRGQARINQASRIPIGGIALRTGLRRLDHVETSPEKQ